MSTTEKKISNRLLKEENRKYGFMPVDIPPPWPVSAGAQVNRIRVLRSRDFLIQIFEEADGVIRITVNRTLIDSSGRWRDDISWDDLQNIKYWCGYGKKFAVEVFPEDGQTVNVANMRHLWVLPEQLSFAWTRTQK